MKLSSKLQILPHGRGETDLTAADAFHESGVQRDLATLAAAPSVLSECVERARIRFRKAGERSVLSHWAEFFEAGERLLTARAGMERRKNEYLQLAREHHLKGAETAATLSKLCADAEEHELRRDKASYQRRHINETPATDVKPEKSEDERKMNDASERRKLDLRWELNESLRALYTLVELQRWRRQQRDLILKDRSLSPDEQSEDLQFIDALYQQKHGELRVDTRIFEEQ